MTKRELSSTPDDLKVFDDADHSPSSATSTPTKKSKKNASASASPSPRKKAADGQKGDWTPEKRAELVEMIWAAGTQALGLGTMAEQLGMSKKQIDNAVCKGQPSNFRSKMIKTARELGK